MICIALLLLLSTARPAQAELQSVGPGQPLLDLPEGLQGEGGGDAEIEDRGDILSSQGAGRLPPGAAQPLAHLAGLRHVLHLHLVLPGVGQHHRHQGGPPHLLHPAVDPGPGGRGVADQHHGALSVDQRPQGAVAAEPCRDNSFSYNSQLKIKQTNSNGSQCWSKEYFELLTYLSNISRYWFEIFGTLNIL